MVKKCIYVDTSILVSLAAQNNERTKKAFEILKQQDELITSEWALLECQSAFSFQFPDGSKDLVSVEQNLLRVLVNVNRYEVTDLVIGAAKLLVKKYRKSHGLRGPDAVHVATSNLVYSMMNQVAPERFRFQYLTADFKQHQVFTDIGYTGYYLE